jgi:hypothetical protein
MKVPYHLERGTSVWPSNTYHFGRRTTPSTTESDSPFAEEPLLPNSHFNFDLILFLSLPAIVTQRLQGFNESHFRTVLQELVPDKRNLAIIDNEGKVIMQKTQVVTMHCSYYVNYLLFFRAVMGSRGGETILKFWNRQNQADKTSNFWREILKKLVISVIAYP